MATKILFETELEIDYDLYNDPDRKAAMLNKIKINIKRFGSLENWYKKFTEENILLRRQFENKVQVWYTWKEQLKFIEKVMAGEIKMTEPEKGVDLTTES